MSHAPPVTRAVNGAPEPRPNVPFNCQWPSRRLSRLSLLRNGLFVPNGNSYRKLLEKTCRRSPLEGPRSPRRLRASCATFCPLPPVKLETSSSIFENVYVPLTWIP